MKKSVLFFSVVAAALMSQAVSTGATLNWAVSSSLEDTQSGQGELYSGIWYATEGIDMYLIFNGVSGTSFSGVEFDNGQLEIAGTDTALTWFDFITSDVNDYTAGNFAIRTASTSISLTTFTPNSTSWNDMDYSFTILAIKDTDGGDYSTGAWYGTYTGDAIGFSAATTSAGTALVSTASLDASGSGLLQVVPEPATFLLFGMGGIGAWLIRRNRMKSQEEADA
jgi:hypothetical protein